MSGNGFEVLPQSLRDAGQSVGDVARRFLTDLDGFQSQMDGYGEPWGADDIGSLIGVAYTEVAAYVFDCLGIAGEELDSAGGDLGGMADAYDLVDEDGAGSMRSLAGGLG
ncbi:hypothetical protein V6V47_07635 [Micromonospora sp. CPCC 205539]|uniref:hypothetical protein n=1 Tax=Micromonospora sp. CPCC 205539 TaxID=3122408 RepID=UPI002FEED548